MKKIILLALITFISCSNESDTLNESVQLNANEQEGDVLSNNKVYDSMPEMNIDISKKYTAVIKTSMGDMSIEFFTEDAPMTVNNFINLSRDGYYDNVIFHRVISGFMIQGGDPSGTGHGEMGKYPGYKFEDELNNQRSYDKGILAMANAGPDTNGSQFFIMHVNYPLPYQYTIFGFVTDGLEVIDKIASVETGDGDKPVNDVVIETVEVKEN
jgi:cyclophilin family peptidyl-prolyl cis-trans isomerase|tara:strand:- start:348 stop:986 length:639 start_codon:yes stop_codon:yes gene_type:complete